MKRFSDNWGLRPTQVIKYITASVCIGIVVFAVSLGDTTKVNARGNQALWDTTYTFDKAIINTFDGKLEVNVKSWQEWDMEDGNCVQVITTDGKVYYTARENVILIKTK